MAQPKQGSRKRRKTALVLGAAGVSLTMAGGASATAPATNVPSQDAAAGIFLAEEEISDVSLATFYVFDKENQSALRQGVRVAAGRGGGCGCGGCHGCGGCAAHGGGGCAARALGCAARGCATLGVTRGTMGVTRGTMAPLGVTRGSMALRTIGPSGMHHHHHHGRGCRGCGCGVDVWIGGCYGCAEDYTDYTSCWQWDPDLGQWVNVCY
jgi:hypothetical protein